MGNSVDATLAYGINLGGSEDWDYGDFAGFNPFDDESLEWLQDDEIDEEIARRYFGTKNPDYASYTQAQADLGIEIERYGYPADGYSSTLIIIPESKIWVDDTHQIVDIQKLALMGREQTRWDLRLKEVTSLLDLKIPGEHGKPKWRLVTSYG